MEAVATVICFVLLVAVFLADVMTPVDVLLSSLALFPVLYAVWTLSALPALLISMAAGGLLGLEAMVGSASPVTVAAEIVAYSALAAFARLYARRIARSTTPSPGPALPATRLDVLTRREREVVVLAAHGRTASEIADVLHIGERTVETHLANAYPKLGVRSKLELVKQAPALGV